jgi:hypothetical protein
LTAEGTGKPLWASENGSQDLNGGAAALIRSITRGYTDAKLTAYINWPQGALSRPSRAPAAGRRDGDRARHRHRGGLVR